MQGEKVEVKVCAMPTCPWYKKTKVFLKDNNVDYKGADAGVYKAVAWRLGGKGVFVINVGGDILAEFDEDELKRTSRL